MEEIIEYLKRIEKRQLELTSKMLMLKKVLTFDECAEYTGMSKSYLYKLTASGEIPHYKPKGKMVYFDRQEIENYLLQNKE